MSTRSGQVLLVVVPRFCSLQAREDKSAVQRPAGERHLREEGGFLFSLSF